MSWGDPVSIGSGAISNYFQSGVIRSSVSVQPPKGTKRIEALMCGGGGGGCSGSNAGGGGFGGLQIYDIPVTGYALDIVIGAGGAAGNVSAGGNGGTTKVFSAGTLYAAVGGGGGGGNMSYSPGSGVYGGCGGGNANSNTGSSGGVGGAPFCYARLLWSLMDHCKTGGIGYLVGYTGYDITYGFTFTVPLGGAANHRLNGADGALGWGAGGGCLFPPGAGAGGGWTSGNALFGGAGGAYAGTGYTSGSLAGITPIWGMVGFAAGTSATNTSGGGGGMLGVGANSVASTTGGNGGDGGGGGGASATSGLAGAGGNGFVVLRFYY